MALNKLAQEILVRATQIISNRDNWIRGAFINERGQVCSLGALKKASEEIRSSNKDPIGTDYGHALNACRAALCKTIGIHVGDIATWNDYGVKGHSEVKRAFCKTVKREVANSD